MQATRKLFLQNMQKFREHVELAIASHRRRDRRAAWQGWVVDNGRERWSIVLDDIYQKDFGGSARLDELARKCRVDQEDEDLALSVYQGMIDAIAERVASRHCMASSSPPVIYIAAYQHRFGVDLSAHRSRDHAESRLLSIAWQQCMRDAGIRTAVDARFGPLVSHEPPLEPPFEADLHQSESVEDGEVHASGSATQASEPAGAMTLAARSGPNAEAVADRGHSGSCDSAQDRREEERRTFCEKLLDEWPDFAPGEALWIVECVVEQEDERARWHGTVGSGDSASDDLHDEWPPSSAA